MSDIHSEELKKLRDELQLVSSQEMQRFQAAAEEHRLADIEQATHALNELHRAELEKTRSEFSSQSEQLEELARQLLDNS